MTSIQLALIILAGGILALAAFGAAITAGERRRRATREHTARMEQVDAAIERARVERARRAAGL